MQGETVCARTQSAVGIIKGLESVGILLATMRGYGVFNK